MRKGTFIREGTDRVEATWDDMGSFTPECLKARGGIYVYIEIERGRERERQIYIYIYRAACLNIIF